MIALQWYTHVSTCGMSFCQTGSTLSQGSTCLNHMSLLASFCDLSTRPCSHTTNLKSFRKQHLEQHREMTLYYCQWYSYIINIVRPIISLPHFQKIFWSRYRLRQGWVFLERTWILNGICFTKHFIEFVFVETNQLVGSNPNVIYMRETWAEQGCRKQR